MSSHHFVKEDQEPALAILNADALTFEKTQELLEWSPTVIVTWHSLQAVLNWKIKIDIVFAPHEEVPSLEVMLADQAPIRFLRYNKEEDLLTGIFDFLINSKYKAVNILVNDELDFDIAKTFSDIDFEVFYENKRWSWIKSGRYERWLPAGIQLYFLPVEAKDGLQTKMLNQDDATISDGKVIVESSIPFWVGEAL